MVHTPIRACHLCLYRPYVTPIRYVLILCVTIVPKAFSLSLSLSSHPISTVLHTQNIISNLSISMILSTITIIDEKANSWSLSQLDMSYGCPQLNYVPWMRVQQRDPQ